MEDGAYGSRKRSAAAVQIICLAQRGLCFPILAFDYPAEPELRYTTVFLISPFLTVRRRVAKLRELIAIFKILRPKLPQIAQNTAHKLAEAINAALQAHAT
jgi:hypothetical protein